MSWHTKNVGGVEHTAAEKAQRQIAYFKSFYATEDARKVSADIRRYIYDWVIETPEAAVAKCAMIDLYEYIRKSAGINDELLVITQESKVPFAEKKPEEETYINLQRIE